MSRSHHLPHQAADGGLNIHFMTLTLAKSSTVFQFTLQNRLTRPTKFVLLSLYIVEGWPRMFINLSRAFRNVSVLNYVTKSRCTQWYTAHVKRTSQAFSPFFRYKGPAKSTPVAWNAREVSVRVVGNVAGSTWKFLPEWRKQVGHLCMTWLIVLLPRNSQNFSRSLLIRNWVPAWWCCTWYHRTSNVTNIWLDGSNTGEQKPATSLPYVSLVLTW